MSMLDDFRKLFFGAKAVTKSQAERAAEAAREAGRDIREQSGEWMDKARRQAGEIGDDVRQGAREATEKGKGALDNLADKLWEEAEHASQRGRELKDKAEQWLKENRGEAPREPRMATEDPLSSEPSAEEHPPFKGNVPPSDDANRLYNEPLAEEQPPRKGSIDFEMETDRGPETTSTPGTPPRKEPIDFEADLEEPRRPSALEELGNQVLDKAAKAGLQAKDMAERAGRKLMDASEDLGEKIKESGVWDKAKDLGDRLADKANELVDKAQHAADQESMDETLRRAKDLHDESEARAGAADERVGRKDTSSTLSGMDDFFTRAERYAQGDYRNEGGKPMQIKQDPDYQKPERPGTVPGFEDLDGDGNEIIDDAILDLDDFNKRAEEDQNDGDDTDKKE